MERKYVLAFWVSFILCSGNAQSVKGFDCLLLRKPIESESFQKQFSICNILKDSVIIKDTSMYFNDCELPDVCGKKFYLSNSKDNSNNANTIVIYSIIKTKRIYNLYFYRPLTGASLNTKLKLKNGKVKLLSYKIGAF